MGGVPSGEVEAVMCVCADGRFLYTSASGHLHIDKSLGGVVGLSQGRSMILVVVQ